MQPIPRSVIAAAVDAALVALFVAIGRASHQEDESAFFVTYWPFLAGLAVGWLVGRAWHRPFAIRTGALAWVSTVVVGMLLRAANGQGVQVAFIVVATIVLGAFLVGWRVLLVAIDRSSTRPEPGIIASLRRRR